jgi:hypothetical protein
MRTRTVLDLSSATAFSRETLLRTLVAKRLVQLPGGRHGPGCASVIGARALDSIPPGPDRMAGSGREVSSSKFTGMSAEWWVVATTNGGWD